MSGFDDPGVYYSDSFGPDPPTDDGQLLRTQIKKRMREFLRQYRVGSDRSGFTFKYRSAPGGREACNSPPIPSPPSYSLPL